MRSIFRAFRFASRSAADDVEPPGSLEQIGRRLTHHPLNVVHHVVPVEIDCHRWVLVPEELGDLCEGHAVGEELGRHEMTQRVKRVGKS